MGLIKRYIFDLKGVKSPRFLTALATVCISNIAIAATPIPISIYFFNNADVTYQVVYKGCIKRSEGSRDSVSCAKYGDEIPVTIMPKTFVKVDFPISIALLIRPIKLVSVSNSVGQHMFARSLDFCSMHVIQDMNILELFQFDSSIACKKGGFIQS